MSTTFNNPPDRKDGSNASLLVEPSKPRTQADLKRHLDSVWKQSLPIFLDRLHRLDTFLASVEEGSFTAEQMDDASTIAHTFAGSLGMFGYPEGTELARSMEQWLDNTPRPNPVKLREYLVGLRAILGL